MYKIGIIYTFISVLVLQLSISIIVVRVYEHTYIAVAQQYLQSFRPLVIGILVSCIIILSSYYLIINY